MGLTPAAILYDAAGNALKVITDGADYVLGSIAKLRNAAGTIVNPATEDSLALIKAKTDGIPTDPAKESGKLTSLETILTAIRDTAGVKKITDAVAATVAQLPGALDGDGNLKVALQQTGTAATKVEGKYAAGAGTPNPVGLGGMDGSTLRAVAVDSQGRIVTAPAGSTTQTKGFRSGYVATTDPVTVALRETTYTEQTSGAQRSIASISANDAAAGTGARTVRVTYYKADLTGPFTEDLTLNGTTGVNTVATDICFIERMEVLTCGTVGGANVGVISIYTAINKGGSVFGSIAAGTGFTRWAHHYIPDGKTCFITGLRLGMGGGGSTSGGGHLKRARPTVANAYENVISDIIRMAMPGYQGTVQATYATPIEVAGPARITMYVSEDGTNDLTWHGSFDFYEQTT